MTEPWHVTPVAPRPSARRAAIAAAIPRIETDRLLLRAPALSDWADLAGIWTSDRAVHIGGPMEEEDAWLDFNQLVASWTLRGFGPLTVTLKATGRVLGLVSLDHEWGDPAPEIGWLFVAAAEGKGYATEAACALRDWAKGEVGADGFEIYLDRSHARSVAVARRIGAVEAGSHPLDPDGVAVWRLPPEPGDTP